ncbi:TerC family protein [Pseudomonas sp. Au-Pse12]|uniref:TerC family protein n=1 Tax=Pseudomonas sp. Au-Pse12 TaxID=2906459 RepID=UPI001E3381E4|nr:TerC family protein [Pseudomonas sp. Au-Pse12]MCE4055719.1 TerC family protein [Pseudomonas sp. Au-Pse12]
MLFDGALYALSMVFQVLLLDLILSGDNALVIALACRGLPPEQARRAIMIGMGAAIILRVLLTTLAGWLLLVPWLKLIGALLLVVIALRLLCDEDAQDESAGAAAAPQTLGGAVLTVLIADLVMSMDNVVGLAAVTQGQVFYLLLGLLLSVPLLMFGSLQLTRLMGTQPWLVWGGGGLLGYVAGSIAVSDPVLVDWLNSQSPALNQVLPLSLAAFVLLQSRIIRQRRVSLPRPLRELEPTPQASSVPDPAVPVAALARSPMQAPQPLAAEGDVVVAPALAGRRFPASGGVLRVLAGLALTLLLCGLLYGLIGGLAGSLLPSPHRDNVYQCDGATATLYYRPGGSSVRLVNGGGEAVGYVRYKEILWQNPQNAAHDLHLTPPTQIEKTSATVVTLNGGSFAQIACTLAP